MKSLGSIRRGFAPWAYPAARPFIAFENFFVSARTLTTTVWPAIGAHLLP
jgi:hypothetical protein